MVSRIQEWAAEQWFNDPVGGTPITAERLNNIENQVEGITLDLNTELGGRLSASALSATITAALGNVADPANVAALLADAAVAAAMYSYEDYGNVSGVVALDPAIGTHVFDATGPTMLTPLAAANGTMIAIRAISGADNVSVDGLVGVELTDGAFATLVRIRGAWVIASSGAGSGNAIPDSTPPSALSGLVAGTPTSTTIPFSWTASSDPDSTVRYAWRIKVGLAAYGPWTTGVMGNSAIATGLAFSSEHTIEVYPYSAGGSATGMTVVASTGAYVPASGEVLTSDGLSGAAGNLGGRVTDLYAGGISRTWSETGVVGGWTVNGSAKLVGPTNGSNAVRMNYGYSGSAIVEFDVVAQGNHLISVGVGAGLTNLGAEFTFGVNQMTQQNVTPAPPMPSDRNNIIGYLGEPNASGNVTGHWTIRIVGTVITVTRPDGYVWNGTTATAQTGTNFVVSGTGYTTGGWEIDNIKVTSP